MEWSKWVPKVIFPRFRGVIRSIKVVSVFHFGHWKCHFWYPQNSQKGVILGILGEPKMALPMPETKNGDHFCRTKYPPKCGKTHLRNHFWPLEWSFSAIATYKTHVFSKSSKEIIFSQPVPNYPNFPPKYG